MRRVPRRLPGGVDGDGGVDRVWVCMVDTQTPDLVGRTVSVVVVIVSDESSVSQQGGD